MVTIFRLNCEYIFRPYNDVLYATKLDYWYLILVFIKKKVSDFGVLMVYIMSMFSAIEFWIYNCVA